MSIKQVSLAGRQVGSIGFGLMGLTSPFKPVSDDNGVVFYGTPERNSLHILHKYFTEYPEDAEKVVLCLKFGFDRATWSVDGSPESIRKEVDKALAVLKGVKSLDTVGLARVDPNTPIEITVGALADLQREGKIGGISLIEVGASTIRRAAKVTPIANVEVEFSLFSTDILSNGVAEACADLNIPIIAYSPLGRGFLTGSLQNRDELPEMLKMMPRFSEENFPKNLHLAQTLEKFASQKGCKASQLALSWVLAHSGQPGLPTIIPIPGTTSVSRLEENMHSVSLSEEEMKQIDEILGSMQVVGGRYPPKLAHLEFA